MSEMTNSQFIADMLKDMESRDAAVVPQTASEDHAPVLDQNDELLEFGDDFDFDGYQVVRREFFAHLNEPSATFNNCKFYVNAACLAKFPKTEYVQALINQESKIMALCPCEEEQRDSFLWCNTSKGKRKPKQITCKLFFAQLFTLMNWNPDYRYKLLGKLIHANGKYLLAFDLTATEVYMKTTTPEGKPKTSRTPVFPAEWQGQFGLPYNENRQSMQINIFDGYAIYAIKDRSQVEKQAESSLPVEPESATALAVVTEHGGENL